MLTTFVIGLREGLEAALIVGVIAAFLTRNSARRMVVWMWVGVGSAVGLSIAAAAALGYANRSLTLRSRETMEGVLALVAVAGVTYMIWWMRRHGRHLAADLEARANEALGRRSAIALVGMAFIAVIREGLETAVFLLATIGQGGSVALGALGAFLGVAVASAIGFGIYRGGVHLDLARFFKVTGILLVLVAAGLVSTAVHELTEAGLITVGTRPAIDLTWLVRPGTIRAGLIGGFLGLQAVPTFIEVAAWLGYFLPMVWFVVSPRRTRRQPVTVAA